VIFADIGTSIYHVPGMLSASNRADPEHQQHVRDRERWKLLPSPHQ
jgi:hypothetical protein